MDMYPSNLIPQFTQITKGIYSDPYLSDSLEKPLTTKAVKRIRKISTKPRVLIVSEDDVEIKRSENKFRCMGYEIKIVKSLAEIFVVANQFFDLVMVSTSIRSYGLNFISLLFKHSHHLDKDKPQLFLVTDVDSMCDKKMASALLGHQVVDGLIVFNR